MTDHKPDCGCNDCRGVEPERYSFKRFVSQMLALHDEKQSEYAAQNESYQNYKAVSRNGREAWKYVMDRITEKHSRVEEFMRTGHWDGESFEKHCLDMANLHAIAAVLNREANNGKA